MRLTLTGEGGLVPWISTVGEAARELYAKARPGHTVMSAEQQSQLLERILEVVWDELSYFRRGDAALPSTSLVSELLQLFAEVKEQGHDLGKVLSEESPLANKDADLLVIWNAYIERCEELNVTDMAGAIAWLAQENPDVVPDGALVLMDTLTPEPPPIEANFIEWLCGRAERSVARRVSCPGMCKVFPDEAPAFPKHAKGNSFADALCSTLFRPPAPGEPSDPLDLSDSVNVIAAPEREGEIDAVAARIRGLIDKGVAPGNITVVFPEPRLYIPLIESTFPRYGIPLSPGTGLALSSSGPVRAVLALLDSVTSDFGKDEVMRLLRSPYVTFDEGVSLDARYIQHIARRVAFSGGKDGWRRVFKARVRQHKLRSDDESLDDDTRRNADREVKRACDQGDVLRRLLGRIDQLAHPMTTATFADEVRALMAELGITDVADEDEAQFASDARTVKAVHRILDELVAASALLGEEERDIARHRDAFQLLVTGRRFFPRIPRSDVVQVVDIGAAQATENEHVFLCGLVEKDFPSVGTPCIVPESNVASEGLFDRDHELRRQRYLFLMAATAAKQKLYVTRPATLSEDPVIASVFLDEIERLFTVGPKDGQVTIPTRRSLQLAAGSALTEKAPVPEELLLSLEPDIRSHAVRATMVENLLRELGVASPYNGVITTPTLADYLKERYDGHAWTATELETYAKCPFWFLARYVWGLREEEEPTAEMSSMEFGNLVHDVLARFVTDLRENGVDLAGGDFNELLGRMQGTVKDVVAVSGGSGVVWDLVGKDLCVVGRRPGLLARWLATEIEQPLPGVEPSFLELALGNPRGVNDPRSLDEPVDVPLPCDEGGMTTLRFTGKVDRIDVDPDRNKGIIIDYKTGTRIVAPKDMTSGRSVQLTLYPLMVEAAVRQGRLKGGPAHVVASGIYHVSPRKPITRKLLGTKAAKKELKAAGAKMYSQTIDKITPMSVAHIIASINSVMTGRFSPPQDPKDSGCVYCVARHLCRSPRAEVAKQW